MPRPYSKMRPFGVRFRCVTFCRSDPPTQPHAHVSDIHIHTCTYITSSPIVGSCVATVLQFCFASCHSAATPEKFPKSIQLKFMRAGEHLNKIQLNSIPHAAEWRAHAHWCGTPSRILPASESIARVCIPPLVECARPRIMFGCYICWVCDYGRCIVSWMHALWFVGVCVCVPM